MIWKKPGKHGLVWVEAQVRFHYCHFLPNNVNCLSIINIFLLPSPYRSRSLTNSNTRGFMNCVFFASPAASMSGSDADCQPSGTNMWRFGRMLQAFASLALLVAALFSSSHLLAQTFYGSISGVVK